MGAASDEEPIHAPSPSCCAEKIYVSVRLRPLNEKEIARNDFSDWECINDNTVIYRNTLSIAERTMYPTSYTFDRVFSCDCSTRKVYEEGAKAVALSVVSGINSSVFAYGQTSSGKTYTMSGITEYTMADIYDYIEKHEEKKFLLKFSALEIYNESVRDLLSADTTPLRLLDDPERGTIVEKLTEETLKDWNHLKELLSFCETQRQIGETSLNQTSSRSHQILRLTIESSASEFSGNDASTLTASVNFVDLAGSERASQALSAGTRLKEGCHINRSLLTLGTVIRKLSKGRNGHVPFRDSKLTRILQSSLGGNARTAIICTMSPARSHVEQSRNTLLFASCAKEVTTNAQVNIVMSDKVLVKHLQRELARLENELRSSGPALSRPDSAAMLREKNLRIQKLEKEVVELTFQRDLALAQVKDLLQQPGEGSDDKPQVVYEAVGRYPKLRVRSSWDFDKIQTENSVNPHCVDISIRSDTSSCSRGHSRESSDDNFFQLPYLEEKTTHIKSYQQDKVRVPKFIIETDLHQEEIEEPNDQNIEYLCKDVRCIQMEESTNTDDDANTSDVQCIQMEESTNTDDDANMSDVRCIQREESKNTDEDANTSSVRCIQVQESTNTADDANTPDVRCIQVEESADTDVHVNKSDSMLNIEGGLNMPSSNVNPAPSGLTESEKGKCAEVRIPTMKKEKEWKGNILDSVTASPKEQPPWFPEKVTYTPSSLKFARSRSCRASIMNGLSSYQFWDDENNAHTPSIVFDKDFTGRPGSLPGKFSTLKYVVDTENSSINGSQISEKSPFDELKKQNIKTSDAAESICVGTSVLQMEDMSDSDHSYPTAQREKMADPQDEKQLAVDEDTQVKSVASIKSVRDIGVDPMQDASVSQWEWALRFERLQSEIIELWHVCNISLVHRTYFLLLFKGDPKDSVYMEVEHRRLSFLKDAFSHCDQAAKDWPTAAQASSIKALREERYMLSRHMQKRFSREQRHNLFLKWGIGLHTKHRRWQFVNLLWTDPKDMDHIAESAAIVEKLVTFVKPGEAFREMFGLNFALRRGPSKSKRPSFWQRSVKAIL